MAGSADFPVKRVNIVDFTWLLCYNFSSFLYTGNRVILQCLCSSMNRKEREIWENM